MEDKNVRKEESFFLLLHVEPSICDHIVPHAPGFLVDNMGQTEAKTTWRLNLNGRYGAVAQV